MTTILPMGLRDDIRVSTTSFSPWARLMTLESRGKDGEHSDTPTAYALLGPSPTTLACCPFATGYGKVPFAQSPHREDFPLSLVSKQAPKSPPPLLGYQVYFLIRLGVERAQHKGSITQGCSLTGWGW